MKTSSRKPPNKWMARNSKPNLGRWYYVHELDGSIGSRYYDDADDKWFAAKHDGFHQNESFTEWLWIPEVCARHKYDK